MSILKRLVSTGCALMALAVTSAFAEPTGDDGQANFGISIYILTPLKVEKDADLLFGSVLAGKRDITINATSAGVAKFSAYGNANARILVRVVQPSLTLRIGTAVGPNNEITVDGWNYGGTIKANGAAQFDSSGSIHDMRVGAVAHVLENSNGGNFRGIATLRVTYI
ncbi:MAG: hypothetical protein P1U34_00050 [Coxiellaceae bacterium]|nr:hypothetical protein [Coxiellaceae bacterium]